MSDGAPEPSSLVERAADRPRNLRPSETVRRLGILARAPLFYALSDPALRALARRLRPVSLAPGVTLVEAGDRGDTVYVVDEGRLRFFDGAVGAGDVVSGGLCGEAALAAVPEPLTVVAVAPTRLLALDATLAEHFLGTDNALVAEARRLAAQRALLAGRQPAATAGGALVVAFLSPKGGSGATTLAVNTAAVLAARRPGRVALLDLALPYCDAGLLGGFTPAGSLAAVSRGAGDDLRERVLGIAVRGAGGFSLVPAALRPEEAELVTPQLATACLRILEREFEIIVVDLGGRLTEVDVAVLERSDQVVVVVPPEVAGVKDAGRVLPLLEEVIAIPRGRIAIVLNQRLDRSPVTPVAVGRALGTDIDLVVDHDGNRPEQLALEGTLAALAHPRSPVGLAAGALAGLLLERAESGPRVAKEE